MLEVKFVDDPWLTQYYSRRKNKNPFDTNDPPPSLPPFFSMLASIKPQL